jgi:hypothetical protein
MCVCELPSRHIKRLSSAKLDNVLGIWVRFGANPVVSKYNIDSAYRRITAITDTIGVVYEWTIPTSIKMEGIDYIRKIWKELMSDIDKVGIDILITKGSGWSVANFFFLLNNSPYL